MGEWGDGRMAKRCWRNCRGPAVGGFTLLEMLVVIVIIALLIALLLPALMGARALAQQVVCGADMHQLGMAMAAYCNQYDGWLPGSPNTSGNRANPGGVGKSLYPGYYPWEPSRDAYPAIHIFDWACPLMLLMNGSVPRDVTSRYQASTEGPFRCSANNWRASVNHISRITEPATVPSFATSRYFTYVPKWRQTGQQGGTLFWAHRFVPHNYLPRMENLGDPTNKVFLADAGRIDRSNPNEISNQEYGYSTHGAWLDIPEVQSGSPSLSYRFAPARNLAFRHRGGINCLMFDGHVKYLPEGSSDAANGYGTGARQARLWFPSGTRTELLPTAGKFSNRRIIVP